MIVVTATDLSSGARFYYSQQMFDILCSDLGAVRLSRAAASSSAVPVVLSPVTIDNYGGTCERKEPPFLTRMEGQSLTWCDPPRAPGELKELRYYENGKLCVLTCIWSTGAFPTISAYAAFSKFWNPSRRST